MLVSAYPQQGFLKPSVKILLGAPEPSKEEQARMAKAVNETYQQASDDGKRTPEINEVVEKATSKLKTDKAETN